MCDTTFSSKFPATYTGEDYANANTYATMRLLYEKMDNFNRTYKRNPANINKPEPLQWVHRYLNGQQTSYPCDMKNPNLKCYEGVIRIANKEECKRVGKYVSYKDIDPVNAYKDYMKFTQWLPPSRNTNNYYDYDFDTSKIDRGDCYYGNWQYKDACDNFFIPQPDREEKKWAFDRFQPLRFDEDTGRCMLTREYCVSTGQNAYTPGTGRNGEGGECELTGGQKAMDYLGGTTFARAGYNLDRLGDSCPKQKKEGAWAK